MKGNGFAQLIWLAMLITLAACGGKHTVHESVDEHNSEPTNPWITRTVEVPEALKEQLNRASAPQVQGTTTHTNEQQASLISDFERYTVRNDFTITTGSLNHTRGEKIISMEAGIGSDLALVPLERSKGQWSLEGTTDSMTHAIAQGRNIIGAINADPFNLYNGWNAGITTIDGVNYSGATLYHDNRADTESAVIVKNNGRVEILKADELPLFSMHWSVNGEVLGEVHRAFYFDKENNKNSAKLFAEPSNTAIEVYSGDNIRSRVEWQGKKAVLVKPQANGVTVVANSDGSNIVQYPPFTGKVVARPSEGNMIVPSGHALIVGKSAALEQIKVGDDFAIRYQSHDPAWAEVKHALGGGFFAGLLVEDGQLSSGAEQQTALSARSALGVRGDGSVFFLTVDKPALSPSDGITLKKLGQIMLAYGAVDAINLDGGGSTTMAYRMPGSDDVQLLNTPSDGVERDTATKWAIELVDGSDEQHLMVLPKQLTMLAGSEYRDVEVIAYNDRFEAVAGDIRLATSDAKLGHVHTDELAFKAGEHASSGYLLARLKEQVAGTKISVVSSLDSLEFEADEIILEPGETRAVLPILKAKSHDVIYQAAQLTLSLSNDDNGEIDEQSGEFTAANVQGGEVQLTASYGDKSDTILIKIGVPPKIIEDFEKTQPHYSASGARALTVSASQSTDIAFAGQKSMALSWQADPSQSGTFGAYLNDVNGKTVIDGYPERIGVHVYIPPELAGKKGWMRGLLRDAEGRSIAIDYNQKSEPLPDAGWHYVDAQVPAGYKAPLSFYMPFRFLVLANKDRMNSTLYLDNFTAIYSDSTDVYGPKLSVSPAQSAHVFTPSPQLQLAASDASGIDEGSLKLSLDGRKISHLMTYAGGVFSHSNMVLADGWHKLQYSLADKHGNISSGEHLFNVLAGQGRIYMDDSHISELHPGATFDIPIAVEGAQAFERFSLQLDYDSSMIDVQVIDSHLAASNIQRQAGQWSAHFSGFNENTKIIATVQITVKDYISKGEAVLSVSGSVNGAEFYYPSIRKPIHSLYKIQNPWVKKNGSGELVVEDKHGKRAARVTVERVEYNSATDTVAGSEVLGSTDEHGQLPYKFNCQHNKQSCTSEFYFRAYDTHGSSLISRVFALESNLSASPQHVYLTPAKTTQALNVTWYTHTDVDETLLRYCTGEVCKQVTGYSEVVPFYYGEDPTLVRIHHARMERLEANTQYTYQVGSTHNLSAEFSYTSADKSGEVRIHLLGDTQTLDNGNIHNGAPLVGELLGKMQAQLPNPDLIMHVGDFSEDISMYHLVNQFMEQITGEGKASSVPLVTAFGNHEACNNGANLFAAMFDYPEGSPTDLLAKDAIYSFSYNNAHIAVINTELFTEHKWQSMMDWLVEDMNQSNKTWKILMLHRPPYEGNPASGNEWVKKYLPAAADAAEIDLVLSGHDHMYSRSKPVKAGKVAVGGTTYLIAGSASAKFYDAGTQGMAPLADVLFDDNIHTYTTLHIQGDELTIETRSIYGELVDKKRLVR